ncbi:MAG: ATP-dependent helicase HrpB [Nevskiales bacterium]
MMKLPDYPVLRALLDLRRALAGQGAAVLAAPPGSGKTTTIPLALLEEPWLQGKSIVLLEPRRVAARAAAARMASLVGESVGQTIGYQIRFERRISSRTRIEVLTEGLLARRLQSDPELAGVGLVIFDEFHERSLDADLALALTLDARANLVPALRVLVMSATLDIQRVAKLLGDAPVVEAGGQLYPVDIRYATPRAAEPFDSALANAVLRALDETDGDILAFLPGAREIRAAQRRVEAHEYAAARAIGVYPLYGELAATEQDAALLPDPAGRRKVILATNLAQTSLTVEGVTTVVDGGYVRVARFDLGAGANRLDTVRVSRASAEQRAGRAGRLAPGVCYRLWSAEQHGRLTAHDTPELLAADLTRFVLELAAWGHANPSALALLDAPPESNWNYARELLQALGALDPQGRITPHGRELARLPAMPRRAHMLLEARRQGLATPAAWTAAILDERSSGTTDLAELINAVRKGRAESGLTRRVRDSARQLLRQVEETETDWVDAPLGRIVSWAYPERIAWRRDGLRGQKEAAFLCVDGGEARLPETDPLAREPWLAIAHWDPGPPRKIRAAVALSEDEVRADHAPRITRKPVVYWDAQSESVVAQEQERLGAIVLSARPLREAGEAARAAMLEGIRSLGLSCLPWTEAARQWQARVMSLRAWRPAEDWPEVGDATLPAALDRWLAPYLDGVTRRAHLAQLDLIGILNNLLDYPRQQSLTRLAPTHIAVPSGQRHALHYNPPEAPSLEVRLQEMFGCTDTPTVNEGRLKLVLHLLSPARRPIAVTQDLAGFWARGYLDVKKDMKGRYPRHPWPDNPAQALPTTRAKPRGR